MIYRLILKFEEEDYHWDFNEWEDRQTVIKGVDGILEWESYELREDDE